MAGVSAGASGQARTPRTPRVRRQRGARESLASIVLGFESIIVFLGGLVLYGLKALPAGIEPWWGIVIGDILGGLCGYAWARFYVERLIRLHGPAPPQGGG